ncbi:MAG: LOG family protein [Lentisphaeria bacterium]|nr:LOG family protein [Lentisphaeria bacterium]
MTSDSRSNLLAVDDAEFMRTDACRGIRLQLEYLKAEQAFIQKRIVSTVVIFGSARLRSPEDSQKILEDAQAALAEAPEDSARRQAVAKAEKLVKYSKYYTMAQEFAKIISTYDQNLTDGFAMVVITGGGPGIMEAGNRGATEVGALSIGLNIKLPFEQAPNPYITPGLSFQYHYFAMRKMHFLKRAVAIAGFPGGFGTLDELFESLTLIQTGVVPKMPILLFGSEFWKKVVNWEYLVETGVISPEDLNLFHFCDSPWEGWNVLKAFYKKTREEGEAE